MTTEQEEMIRIRVDHGELLTTYQQKDLLVELDRERHKSKKLEARIDNIHEALCCCRPGEDDGCGCRCSTPEELAGVVDTLRHQES